VPSLQISIQRKGFPALHHEGPVVRFSHGIRVASSLAERRNGNENQNECEGWLPQGWW
jgi:hypothetical protein